MSRMGDVVGKRVGLLAGLLVLTMGSGAVAQEPSPEPPPWFGGRVEMPEHGFAVTVLDGWVVFDLTGDMDEQIASAAARLDGDTDLLARNAGQARRDGQLLWFVPVTMESGCGFGLVPEVPLGADLVELGARVHAGFSNDPNATEVRPPEHVELPAGPAFNITQVLGSAELAFWLGQGAATFALSCAGAEAPDDNWLSIVETIEFLPVEE